MARMSRFTKTRYLNKDDVLDSEGGTIVCTIDHLSNAIIQREDRLVLHAAELPHPWPLNSTNIGALMAITGKDDTDACRGVTIEVYVDETIVFDNEVRGGLRLRSAVPKGSKSRDPAAR